MQKIISIEEIEDPLTGRAMWVPIIGFDGAYEVSAHGHVRSYRRRGTKSLSKDPVEMAKPTCRKGYIRYCLRRPDGRSTNLAAHRIVAEHFICKGPPGLQVDHIDGNKLNNHVSNLRWVTASENIGAAIRAGLRLPGNQNVVDALKKIPDKYMPLVFTMREIGLNPRQISEAFGVSRGAVRGILSGRRIEAGRYIDSVQGAGELCPVTGKLLKVFK